MNLDSARLSYLDVDHPETFLHSAFSFVLTGRKFHPREQTYSVRSHCSWDHITHKIILWKRATRNRIDVWASHILPSQVLDDQLGL